MEFTAAAAAPSALVPRPPPPRPCDSSGTKPPRLVSQGALPGYGAIGQVEEGDLVRAVTAFASVVGDAPMWQQAKRTTAALLRTLAAASAVML